MLGHMVCVRVRHEPGNEGSGHGGQKESPRACQSAPCQARKGCIIISRARLANRPNRIDVSRYEEEEGYSTAATHDETEEG
jgi:hypothetical protein